MLHCFVVSITFSFGHGRTDALVRSPKNRRVRHHPNVCCHHSLGTLNIGFVAARDCRSEQSSVDCLNREGTRPLKQKMRSARTNRDGNDKRRVSGSTICSSTIERPYTKLTASMGAGTKGGNPADASKREEDLWPLDISPSSTAIGMKCLHEPTQAVTVPQRKRKNYGSISPVIPPLVSSSAPAPSSSASASSNSCLEKSFQHGRQNATFDTAVDLRDRETLDTRTSTPASTESTAFNRILSQSFRPIEGT